MLVLIAHTFDQLVYALVSYTPHAFTLVLLELVASAMLFPCKQQLLINARMNQHAYGNHNYASLCIILYGRGQKKVNVAQP